MLRQIGVGLGALIGLVTFSGAETEPYDGRYVMAVAPARLGYPECRRARRRFGPFGRRLPVTWGAGSMARWPAPTASEPRPQG
jgi:hypothetical protein